MGYVVDDEETPTPLPLRISSPKDAMEGIPNSYLTTSSFFQRSEADLITNEVKELAMSLIDSQKCDLDHFRKLTEKQWDEIENRGLKIKKLKQKIADSKLKMKARSTELIEKLAKKDEQILKLRAIIEAQNNVDWQVKSSPDGADTDLTSLLQKVAKFEVQLELCKQES